MLLEPHRKSPPGALVIGLVNNMPGAASLATERQFRRLLGAASGRAVQLRCFMPPRAATFSHHAPHHEPLAAVWDAELDGLIVTGAEPRAADLTDEPTWPLLANLVDWASERTTSTIWSCLAAHAVVQRLDDLPRHRLPKKLSGLFPCARVGDHPLLRALPRHWATPHSRCNDLDAASLVEQGYRILSSGPEVGADCFIKQSGGSLFVMLQGHPEYDADSLAREYRRDVKRFFTAGLAYPNLPQNLFGAATEAALQALRAQAQTQPARPVLAQLDSLIDGACQHLWQASATQLYAGWLGLLASQKTAHRPILRRQASALVHP